MTKISRADIYARDEKGPSWFDEFLHSMAGHQQPSNIQEILEMINNTRGKSIDSVMQQYKEETGLNLINSALDDEPFTKSAAGLGPISPMKLNKLTNPEEILKNHDESEIIIQVKFDGFKTQAIKDKDGTKVYTRRGEEFTENVSDLIKDIDSKIKPGTFLLGELVWEDKQGKQSISDIQTVVGSAPEKAKEKINSGTGTMVLYVYDLLWDNSKDITKTKYIDRYNKLKSMIGKGTSHLKVAENYSYAEKNKAIKDALAAGGEGIVLKPKDSEYKYGPKGSGEQHGEWAKFKPSSKSHTDEVILKDYSKGKEKIIFPMYQYKESELFEVGQLSGMSKEDETKIKKDIDAGKTIVVEITYQERMSSGKFRHVGWSRFRPDKPAKEVKMSKALFRPLSIRHAHDHSIIIDKIENDPEVMRDIESFCQHSGGFKSTISIINFLRKKFPNDLISFTDKGLIAYIDKIKESHKAESGKTSLDVGSVGTRSEDNNDDNIADYVMHGAK